jgi:TATA-binding protein-associated factor
LTDITRNPDEFLDKDDQTGQDVVDCLTIVQTVVPTLHESLWEQVKTLFPMLSYALRSRYAVVRQSAARCFAAVCDIITIEGMRHVVEVVVPFLGDASLVHNRQGAVELVYRRLRLNGHVASLMT